MFLLWFFKFPTARSKATAPGANSAQRRTSRQPTKTLALARRSLRTEVQLTSKHHMNEDM